MIERVVSGGQTGVDRAALDAAMEAGIDCGGWCPSGRRAEDGPIPDRYPLTETDSERYLERTRLNVEDSDATLILTRRAPTGGTRLTVEHAERTGRPFRIVDLTFPDDDGDAELTRLRDWIEENAVDVLNVAGPRESTRPGIHAAATAFLRRLFGEA